MRALKKARKLIENHPTRLEAEVLSRLVLALESDQPFRLAELYELDYDGFNLAMEVMMEWRLDRYYTRKAVLLDLSMQLDQARKPAAPGSAPAAGDD